MATSEAERSEFGALLYAARTNRGLTADEVVAQLNDKLNGAWKRQSISLWERTTMPRDRKREVVEALDEILELDGELVAVAYNVDGRTLTLRQDVIDLRQQVAGLEDRLGRGLEALEARLEEVIQRLGGPQPPGPDD